MERLREGDPEDRRLLREQRPVALSEALRETVELWSSPAPAREDPRYRREEDRPREEAPGRREGIREPEVTQPARETGADPALQERYRRVNPDPDTQR